MRRAKFVLLCLCLVQAFVPRHASAQNDCFDCVLGIWDEPEMQHNFGTVEANVPKTLYIGIRFAGGETELSGVEFSVSGLGEFQLGPLESIVPEQLRLGDFVSPPDTSAGTPERGGINVAWGDCMVGNQALFRFSILSQGTPPLDHIIEVKRRYPPTNADFRSPLFVKCDDPIFNKVRVTGGCYLLNPSEEPTPACRIVPVQPSTWTTLKSLYR